LIYQALEKIFGLVFCYFFDLPGFRKDFWFSFLLLF
jgi:hypothetical protein